MSDLDIRLFGSFDVHWGGERLTRFRTNKVQALLAYLVTEPLYAWPREKLLVLLWPDMPQESAQTNLRQIIYQLRKMIPDVASRSGDTRVPFILGDRHTVQINPDSDIAVDVVLFDACLTAVHSHVHSDRLTCTTCLVQLEQAVKLYNSHFLADFYLDDSNEFEDWAQRHREAYRRQMMDALSSLAEMSLRQGRFADADARARQQLTYDELDERAYRHLMEALARDGRRLDALAAYQVARRTLWDELGMEPAAQTRRLAEQIEADSLEAVPAAPAATRGYQLVHEIGSGAFGVVHRARQPGVGREVAIKIIDPRYANHPDFIRRFETEAQTIARLEHPNIVPLYDYWREPDSAYLVMRWLRGGNLDHRLAGGPLSLDETVRMVDQLTAALQTAHRQQIIHRDVKSANILLDDDGNAYLADFGVARDLLTEQDPGGSSWSQLYSSPEQRRQETLTPQSDQYGLGLVIYQMLTGELPFADGRRAEGLARDSEIPLLPLVGARVSGLPPAVDEVIRRATAANPADRYPDMIALGRAFRQAAGSTGAEVSIESGLGTDSAAQATAILNPYIGLRAFEESDVATFFGRDVLVGQLAARLSESAVPDPRRERFLVVVGPSGAGKSSVIKAGLIPALRRGAVAGSERWFITEMTPGRNPMEELSLALMRVAVDPPTNLLESLLVDEEGLARVLGRILPYDEEGTTPQMLLVIDQLEELFTLTTDVTHRELFIDSLLYALGEPDSRLRVVATLRADFYDRPLQMPHLGDLLRYRTEVVLPLTPVELEQVIVRPAALAGVGFGAGLLPAITADVADQPGTLPLLQYALTELFEARTNGTMTADTYAAIGRVAGALGRRADEIYVALDSAAQEGVRQLFLRLVTLGEGVEDTRRRVLRSELEGLQIPGAAMGTVIDEFGRYRLLTFDHDPLTRGPTVEVAHEALLREWPRLREWLDESRDNVRLQRLLAREAAEWTAADHVEGYLLRGSRLDQFENWAEQSNVLLTAEEAAFLATSQKARQQRRTDEEARRQRELETAQQLAATESQRAEEQAANAVKLRRRALLLAVALAGAGLLAFVAFGFARSSNANAATAATRAAEANSNAALAVENANVASTRQAEAAANAALAATRESEAVAEAESRAIAEANAAEQRDVAISREREALESYSLSLAANARQALDSDDQQLALLLALAANTVEDPPLNAWRTLLDVAYAPGAIRAFEVGSAVNSLEVSPDGRTMLSASDDGLIRQWDIESGVVEQMLAGHQNAVMQVVLSSDATQALSGGADSKAILWDMVSGEILKEFIGHGNPVRSVAFIPGGRQALTGEDSLQLQGELIVWDLDTGEPVRRFGGDLEEVIEGVLSIAVSPDGQLALVGYGKGSSFDTQSAVLWDIEAGEVVHFLEGSEQSINSVAISPDGRLGYGASGDSNIYIWDLASGQLEQTLRGHEGSVTKIALSPNGLSAVSGALDDTIFLWDLAAGEPAERFSEHQNAVLGIGFQGNSRAISGSADGTLRLWDLTGEWQQAHWRDPEQPADHILQYMEISPDGRYVLTESWQRGTGMDPILTLWDYENGTPIRRLEPVESQINDIAFTPDSLKAVTTHADGYLSLWDLTTGQKVGHYPSHAGWTYGVDVSSDGRFVVSVGIDDQVIYQDLATGEILQRMTGHFEGRGTLDVKFLPGDRQAISASWDGTQIIWDLTTGEQIHRLTGLTGGEGGHLFAAGQDGSAVNEIAVAANGRQILSAGNDKTLLLWDLATGESVLRFSGHSGPVAKMDLTPDGRYALSGARDEPMIMWDMATGQPIRRFSFRNSDGGGFYPSLTIHPSGQTALTDDIDGSIIKWQLAEPDPPELIEWLSGNRALRELTCPERETFQIEPLCEGDETVSTTADMLAEASLAVGTLVTSPVVALPEPSTNQSLDLAPPDRTPKIAVLGDNRGELERGNFDVWLYEGRAGEIISIKMIADNPLTDPTIPLAERYEAGILDTRLYVINPDGTILQRIDDEITPELEVFSDANLVAVKLATDGQYRIEARSSLDDHAGGYTLHIEQREAVGNAELFSKYVGYYVEGPWQYDTYIFLDGDRLMQSFDYSGALGFENIAISETEFISAVDSSLTVFTRDENGQVNGYQILVSLIHPVARQWYYAERVGDLPPDFYINLAKLREESGE